MSVSKQEWEMDPDGRPCQSFCSRRKEPEPWSPSKARGQLHLHPPTPPYPGAGKAPPSEWPPQSISPPPALHVPSEDARFIRPPVLQSSSLVGRAGGVQHVSPPHPLDTESCRQAPHGLSTPQSFPLQRPSAWPEGGLCAEQGQVGRAPLPRASPLSSPLTTWPPGGMKCARQGLSSGSHAQHHPPGGHRGKTPTTLQMLTPPPRSSAPSKKPQACPGHQLPGGGGAGCQFSTQAACRCRGGATPAAAHRPGRGSGRSAARTAGTPPQPLSLQQGLCPSLAVFTPLTACPPAPRQPRDR